ncbi:MAG: glycosyltransferase family 4 protein [Firmicutes bacterium]|nr:glycosyltransferase family 4 protein [Bacillota bacterium]
MNQNHIAIDGRGALFYRGTGIGTYTWQMLSHLPKEIPDLQIFLPGMEYQNFTFSAHSCTEQKDLWRDDFLPKALAEKGIGLYHVPQNGIGLPCRKICKETVTIHDLIPYLYPETVGRGYLKEFLKEMPKIMERSDGIITVSECSAGDIRRIFDYPKEKIHVIHEAPEPIYRPIDKAEVKAFLSEKYGIYGDYILYVGGFGIRKNVKALINAFYLLKREEAFPLKLVLPGKRNRDHDGLDALVEALQIEKDVIFPDYVPVADLPYFYNGAAMMVYPSIYEGFGLPPLEAMACGTPVIAAKTSSLPEILGSAALWCNPFDTTDIAGQMHRLYVSPTLRSHLSQKGKEKAASYTWQKAAVETADFFRKILR